MTRKQFIRLILLSPLSFFIPQWLRFKKKPQYDFKTYTYPAYKEVVLGKVPADSYLSNFGMLIPQGTTKDSKGNKIPILRWQKAREYDKEEAV